MWFKPTRAHGVHRTDLVASLYPTRGAIYKRPVYTWFYLAVYRGLSFDVDILTYQTGRKK